MSDFEDGDDFMMEQDSEEEYDFDYEDGSDYDADVTGDGGEVDMENAYYGAKSTDIIIKTSHFVHIIIIGLELDKKDADAKAALQGFEAVVGMESQKGEWYI